MALYPFADKRQLLSVVPISWIISEPASFSIKYVQIVPQIVK
jgi:hypothetical protein